MLQADRQKIRDFLSRYRKLLIKEYKHWAIYAYANQSYLGRCVVWCKREDALDLADATEEEQKELFLVLRALREAAKKVFQPDWFNFSFLGNQGRHLHGHFVPRYAKPKTFMGIVFEDKLYGHNFQTDPNFITPEAVLNAVRDKLAEALIDQNVPQGSQTASEADRRN